MHYPETICTWLVMLTATCQCYKTIIKTAVYQIVFDSTIGLPCGFYHFMSHFESTALLLVSEWYT